MELEVLIGAGTVKVLQQEPAGSVTSGIFIVRGCDSSPNTGMAGEGHRLHLVE